MARKLVVEIIGDASSLEKSYRQASKATGKLGQQIESASRGAVRGTFAFKGLGRSIAFAGGSFLAFESATEFLRSSVDAAREADVAQRSLAAQMKASSESFKQNRDVIEKSVLSYAQFGFENDKVIESLTVLERGTQHINQALQLLGVTADIARAKNIDLSAAANVVAKVFGGQETALRRAVPGLSKTAHGWDLIREAQRRVAGQARANTTSAERFNATLHDTQEIIGTGLLPILNRYLDQLTKWLDKMNRSGQLQKDVNRFVTDATPVFHGAGVAIGFAATALGKYQGLLDKTREGSKSAKPEVRALSDVVRLLVDPGYGLGKAEQLASKLSDTLSRLGDNAKKAANGLEFLQGPVGTPISGPPAGLQGPLSPGKQPKLPKGATVEQRNTWFDNLIGRMELRAGLLSSLKQQLAAWKQIPPLLQARINITKDVTRKQNLIDQLLQAQARIREIEDQQQANRDAAEQARAEKARARQRKLNELAKANVAAAMERIRLINKAAVAQEKSIAARGTRLRQQRLKGEQADQFRALGLTAAGDQPLTQVTPGRLRALLRAIRGTDQDTAANRTFLQGGIADLLGRNGKVTKATVQKISEFYDTINAALKTGAKDTLPYFKRYSAASIVASLGAGLTGGQRRQLELKLSALGPGMTVPGGRSAAYAAAGARPNNIVIHTVHVNGVQDMAGFEDAIVRRQRARAYARRGAR